MTEEDNKSSSVRYDMPGCITTHKNKMEMVHILMEDYMKKKRVVFYRSFIVAEQEYSVVDNVKKEFVNQLRNFCQKKIPRRDHDGATVFELTYTGKLNGNNDDFVMTLLIAVYMYRKFFGTEKYRKYW